MASLNRIFTKRIYKYEENELTSSGSETESIQDVEDYESDEFIPSRKCIVPSDGIVSGQKPKRDMKLERNPTRRPNPKISNRNALLARENRRRKKEHVESLEKELDKLKHVNRVIRKEMKKKTRAVEQLMREKNYLKNVIANRTGIMRVLDAIRGSGLNMTSSDLSYVKNSCTPARSSSDEGFASPHPMPLNEFNKHDLGMASQQIFDEEFSCFPDVEELLSTMTNGPAEFSSEQVPPEQKKAVVFASISYPVAAFR
ncbi:uncharacterized protein LOC128741900 isoform X2 [Sabethes cyaneus]|uniref:uncharacterized protein LOC128741900 isoform X2 n=1 Tax=Sabethes cyaneus TaxID=53552 RepID=UPI00237DF539|nr:uncharacterized protein LOC128741900 isoform X2 [Sabethes cyaneus]XP_053694016.1 uncharacterized protein LOC128741900 isoform X2 [Sabethes cyaneus]